MKYKIGDKVIIKNPKICKIGWEWEGKKVTVSKVGIDMVFFNPFNEAGSGFIDKDIALNLNAIESARADSIYF